MYFPSPLLPKYLISFHNLNVDAVFFNRSRNALTEVSVLSDILQISRWAKDQPYMVLDPVSQEAAPPVKQVQTIQLVDKKKVRTMQLVDKKKRRIYEVACCVYKQGWKKLFISHKAGQFSHNLYVFFMYKKTKFPCKFQNFPPNTNISPWISLPNYPFFPTMFTNILRLRIFGNFAPGYSRLISGGILGSRKLPLLRKSYTHCMISNYQCQYSVNRIVIARDRKPLCSDLPFKMRWFRPSNPIKC